MPATARRAWVPAGVALVAAAAAIGLAGHHPWSAPIAIGLVLALAFCTAWRPLLGLSMLLGTLPLVGLMPWTGWITVEELDLAVLAVAAGGHARLAWKPPVRVVVPSRSALLGGLLWLAYAVALALSLQRGLADAGGLTWGWWQGYHESMNSLRLGKSLFLALCLVPLWRHVCHAQPQAAPLALARALAVSLSSVSLAALWERLAYTDLLDFSTDYRTTALFWEMHVGGAALDGFLALTMPFAVLMLQRARTAWHWGLAAAVLMVGAYACLTTFSRIVYLAVPLGLAVMFGLQRLQTQRAGLAAAQAVSGLRAGVVLFAAFAMAASTSFAGSGYRGLLALLGCAMLLLPLPSLLRGCRPVDWVIGLAGGLLLSWFGWGAAMVVPKGAYLAYAAVWALGCLAVWRARDGTQADCSPAVLAGLRCLALASFIASLACALVVGQHWGGGPGWTGLLPGVGLLLTGLAWGASRRAGPAWPASLRWQGSLIGWMAVLCALVGVLMGGAYLGDRVATASDDIAGRQQHWVRGLSWLDSPTDWMFGKGVGRFVANSFMSGQLEDQTGDYRLRTDHGESRLVISGGKYPIAWGRVLRVSQRTSLPAGRVTLRFDARANESVGLYLDVCEKHLLYNGACLLKNIELQAQPDRWQPVTVVLDGSALSGGAWYARRFIVFSIGVGTTGRTVEIDNLSLVDGAGRELLVNGAFDDGLARWFFTSDHHHLPWHMKSMALHVLFEQGVLGLGLLAALNAAALWRLVGGNARRHELAPPLAAGLLGLLAVGLVDSLLDAPRIAFLYYTLLILALGLPGRSGSLRGASSAPP